MWKKVKIFKTEKQKSFLGSGLFLKGKEKEPRKERKEGLKNIF
jgi:hypothetical protein